MAVSVMLMASASLLAQSTRSVDVRPKIDSLKVLSNGPDSLRLSMTLTWYIQGPDTLKRTDTLCTSLFIDNVLVHTATNIGNLDSFFIKPYGFLLWSNDALRIWPNISTTPISNGNHTFCVEVFPRGPNMNDPNVSNNRYCVSAYATPIGVENVSDEMVSFYPHPTDHVLNWKIPVAKIIQELAIYSVTGQQALRKTISATENSLPVGHLPTGIYCVQVMYLDGEIYRQLIQIQH